MQGKQTSAAAHATDVLRQRVVDGVYAPGARFPSATAISEEFGFDRGTAARILAQLRESGFIITKPGSGSHVRTFEPILRVFPNRLSTWRDGQAIQDADTGKRARVVEVNVGERPASEKVAASLGLAPGDPVLCRSRRFAVEDRPVQLADSFYLPEMVRATPIVYTDTGPGGVYARLAEIGHAPVCFAEHLRVRMPLPTEKAALDLPGGTPVIAIVRTAFDAEDRCVEVTEMILDSSVYELEYRADL
ncbi:GntR family transcriptional regulator [Glycomyces harbinensis]|uniref:GntR family transcriptional regulator n=1 Tax=Glycomyces harbinensis TaxID=58114 RepID=A0A1G6YXQ0_9ACTN|nr:GntR family transcriptional regulator [Glycomyces harbinensis]SDD94356.1 GntR family transcriptional regulator [Glycomyces harbinensis]